MSSARTAKVTITEDAIASLEEIGYDYARQGDYSKASKVWALVLQFRGEAGFGCEIDESAGMAEPQSLDAWREQRCIK